MRRSWWLIGVLAALLPALASGAENARTMLDFTKVGPLKGYLDTSMGVAKSYLPLAFMAAVALEAILHSPGVPRNFAAVAWRLAVILCLLWNYERVFGFVIQVTDDIADRLSPANATEEYHAYLDKAYEAKEAAQGPPPLTAPPLIGSGDPLLQGDDGGGSRQGKYESKWSVGNVVFDGTMGALLFLAKALVYGLERLARILAAVFFILGPLALVAGIPRQSRTAEKWFQHFVTVAAWPIFSGVLLGVMTAVAKQSVAGGGGTALGNLVSAVVMGFCALAAPFLSGWIIGGATQNLASLGHASFESGRQAATQVLRHVKAWLPQKKQGNGGTTVEPRAKEATPKTPGRGGVARNPPRS